MTSNDAVSADTAAKPSARIFDRAGFVVLNALLEASELPEIRDLVASILCSPGEQVCRRPHNALFPLRWNDRPVQLVLDSSPRIELLRAVAGANDLRWISGYISIKEAHSPALWWHQDWWCWDHSASYQRSPVQMAVLCYLAETTIENGALRVLPGSHHASAPIHAHLPDAHSRFPTDPDPGDPAMSNLPGQVTLALKAGDAVVLDYRLLHGTHANTSDFRRDCIILNFAPAWRQLPEDIRAHLISHPAQPLEHEIVPPWLLHRELLPAFSGVRRDLTVNRNAPPTFRVPALRPGLSPAG
jgi:hypothetical protein